MIRLGKAFVHGFINGSAQAADIFENLKTDLEDDLANINDEDTRNSFFEGYIDAIIRHLSDLAPALSLTINPFANNQEAVE